MYHNTTDSVGAERLRPETNRIRVHVPGITKENYQ